MKLYYTPGSCSLPPHIVLEELGLQCDFEKVDIRTIPHTTETGKLFSEINPKGSVPLLVLDNGEMLTECSVILQYLADRVPEKKLIPAHGTMERYRLQEWLNYISSEVHKGIGILFQLSLPEEIRKVVIDRINKRLDFLVSKLNARHYLMDDFSIADAYLFTCLGWLKVLHLPLDPWPVLQSYQQRVAGRSTVQSVLRQEGLI